MTLYRKKPVVIEAFLFGFDDQPEWCLNNENIEHIASDKGDWLRIKTLEGIMTADIGDYVIKGVMGEIYPCKADIFALTYEKV